MTRNDDWPQFKEANEEIDGDDRPVTSHLSQLTSKKTVGGLKNCCAPEPRHTAPPAVPHGLYFCAYCAAPAQH